MSSRPVESEGRGLSNDKLEEAAAYLKSISNRPACSRICYQVKKRNGQQYVVRAQVAKATGSGKVCSNCGNHIYHAKTETSLPTEEIAWPEEIQRITTCKKNGVTFPATGKFDPCQCIGDCFWDVCKNVASATFCTPTCCNLGVRSSNAPRVLKTLRLFATGRVGLGAYTNTSLDVGDVVDEYCGKLSEFPANVEWQPDQAVKQNSGFTLLYNAKSTKRNYVYVDALKCRSITRFIWPACDPNAAFVEQQTRARIKVLVKMIKDVNTGNQITDHHGNERWFKCACDDCCKASDNDDGHEGYVGQDTNK
ncbi:hypothetical protein PC115_g17904 [Phytophthora cactorum]|uniref:SET domain-containing protein n=1 Tax=Phytophthora cactorum TaxID=29920 RepID=A0A8T1B5B3_9STRA|nr:hypothetical protein PC115_g17904 [Phytophthora cactorum]